MAYDLIIHQTSELQYDKSPKADFVRPKDVFRDLTKLRRQQECPERNRFRKRNNNIALVPRFFVNFFIVPAQLRREITKF